MGKAMDVKSHRPLRIVQVLSSTDNPAAGTTYCVTRLSETLAARGHVVDLLSVGMPALSRSGSLTRETFAQAMPAVPIASRLMVSPGLHRALDRHAQEGAILHGNGLWLMPNVYPSGSAIRARSPLVISPHGMLGPAALAFSARKKRVFAALFQRRALVAATCLHATSRQEHDEIRAYGLSGPVAIVPNGIDIPDITWPAETAEHSQRTLLHLGRIHPKKGIDRLLRAWAEVEVRHSAWRLRIVGPSEGGHGDALRALAQSLSLKRVTFEDGLFGAAKKDAFGAADLFVLPTLNENFAMVVAESLAHGTPVISTKGAPWSGLDENGCGWWIDHGVDTLASVLDQVLRLPRSELRRMGHKGRDWMRRSFSWERIGNDMTDVYRWVAQQGDWPDCVVGPAR